MKKNIFFIAGLLALALTFALVSIGCDSLIDDGNKGGTTEGLDDDPVLSGEITITDGANPIATATTGATLTAAYSGPESGINYQWKKDRMNIPGETGVTYMPGTAGSYTVTISATGYQRKMSAAVTVTGVAIPALTGTITISPATAITGVMLTVAYNGGESGIGYQWNWNGIAINGEIHATYTPRMAGNYTVTVSATGCQSKTSGAVTVTEGLPPDSGANALSGKTYYGPTYLRDNEKIVFAARTYTIWSVTRTAENPDLEVGKFKYIERENGAYSWDASAKTVTFKPEKINESHVVSGTDIWPGLQSKDEYRAAQQAIVDGLSEAEIAELLTQLSCPRSEFVNVVVNLTFANRTSEYTLSTDGAALFLSEILPANNIGPPNELNGKTFASQDPMSQNTVVFTAAEYSVKDGSSAVIETGLYQYDTTNVSSDGGKRVYLKPLTVTGKDVVQYYDSLGSIPEGYYESADAAKAAATNDKFAVDESRYYPDGKIRH